MNFATVKSVFSTNEPVGVFNFLLLFLLTRFQYFHSFLSRYFICLSVCFVWNFDNCLFLSLSLSSILLTFSVTYIISEINSNFLNFQSLVVFLSYFSFLNRIFRSFNILLSVCILLVYLYSFLSICLFCCLSVCLSILEYSGGGLSCWAVVSHPSLPILVSQLNNFQFKCENRN